MRPAAALFLPLLVSVVAGCGGSGPAAGDTKASNPKPGSLEALWRAPGEDVAVVAGTSDYEPDGGADPVSSPAAEPELPQPATMTDARRRNSSTAAGRMRARKGSRSEIRL